MGLGKKCIETIVAIHFMPTLTEEPRECTPKVSKVEYAGKALNEMALALGPGGKLPTVRELRRSLGVAHTTLSDALWDLEARGVVDRKHGSGIYVSPRIHQKTIGLVFGFDIFSRNVSPFYRLLFQTAQSEIGQRKGKFRFYLDFPHGEGALAAADLVEDIQNGRIHGLIGVGLLDETLHRLKQQSIPLVILSSGHGRRSVYEVGCDWNEMIRAGVTELSRAGGRRIGLMMSRGLRCDSKGGEIAAQDVFRGMLEQAGCPFLPSLYFEYPAVPMTRPNDLPLDHLEWSRRTVLQFFRKNQDVQLRPDGLLILDDRFAYGTLLTLDELKIRVGNDLKIASQSSRGMPPFAGRELILLELEPNLIAQALLTTLRALMEGGQPKDEVVVVQPQVRYQHVHEPAHHENHD